jgi:hypothetical protein
MPDGRPQSPGGWNRVILHVKNLPERIETLEREWAFISATAWKTVPAGGRFSSRIRTAIQSNCSSLRPRAAENLAEVPAPSPVL